MSFLGLEQLFIYFYVVFTLVSAMMKTCSEGYNKNEHELETGFRSMLEAQGVVRGQDVRSLSTSPVSAHIRLRGANGPNSHWLCVSISAV